MLNAILQLEAQDECRESATEAVLMVWRHNRKREKRSADSG